MSTARAIAMSIPLRTSPSISCRRSRPQQSWNSDENWQVAGFSPRDVLPARTAHNTQRMLREGRLEAHSAKRELHCQTRDAFHCFGFSSPRSPRFPQPVTSLWRTRLHLFHLTNGDSLTTSCPFASARSRETTLSRRSRAQCPTCSFYVSWNHKQGSM